MVLAPSSEDDDAPTESAKHPRAGPLFERIVQRVERGADQVVDGTRSALQPQALERPTRHPRRQVKGQVVGTVDGNGLEAGGSQLFTERLLVVETYVRRIPSEPRTSLQHRRRAPKDMRQRS